MRYFVDDLCYADDWLKHHVIYEDDWELTPNNNQFAKPVSHSTDLLHHSAIILWSSSRQ